jgi:hypothetical protein
MLQSRRISIWTSLQQGDVVTLSRRGIKCHKGFIDDRTDDGRTIWVVDEIGHRRLFHIQDDYDLVIADDVYAY